MYEINNVIAQCYLENGSHFNIAREFIFVFFSKYSLIVSVKLVRPYIFSSFIFMDCSQNQNLSNSSVHEKFKTPR